MVVKHNIKTGSILLTCYHEDDFEVKAEWNFFATSHGKSVCDGIGGTIKRAVAKNSVRPHFDSRILLQLL